jgi:hypothetical protein
VLYSIYGIYFLFRDWHRTTSSSGDYLYYRLKTVATDIRSSSRANACYGYDSKQQPRCPLSNMRLSLRVVAAVEQATVRDVGKSGNSRIGENSWEEFKTCGKKIKFSFAIARELLISKPHDF